MEDYAKELSIETRQLPGEELGGLARKMVDEKDPKRRAQIREEIVTGFYGEDMLDLD